MASAVALSRGDSRFSAAPLTLKKRESSSPSPRWREIALFKKDAEGHVIRVDGTPKRFTYIEDTKTGDLYQNDERCTVATKCALIVLGLPLFAAGVIIWNLCKIVVDIVALAIKTIQLLAKEWSEKGAKEALKNAGWEFCSKFFKVILCEDIWQVVSTPFYATGMLFSAAFGVVCPYLGRKGVAKIEYHWHGKMPHRRDFRRMQVGEPMGCCAPILTDPKEARVFFLAYCFQVKGNSRDANRFAHKV